MKPNGSDVAKKFSFDYLSIFAINNFFIKTKAEGSTQGVLRVQTNILLQEFEKFSQTILINMHKNLIICMGAFSIMGNRAIEKAQNKHNQMQSQISRHQHTQHILTIYTQSNGKGTLTQQQLS